MSFNSAWDVLTVSGAYWGREHATKEPPLHGGILTSALPQLDAQAFKGSRSCRGGSAAHS